MKTSLKSEIKSLESAINDVNSKLLANYSVDLINIRQLLEWRLAAKSQKLINEKPKCWWFGKSKKNRMGNRLKIDDLENSKKSIIGWEWGDYENVKKCLKTANCLSLNYLPMFHVEHFYSLNFPKKSGPKKKFKNHKNFQLCLKVVTICQKTYLIIVKKQANTICFLHVY